MTLISRRETMIEVNGAALRPDISGALAWPQRNILIVADLHLEKGSSYARRGQLLPPYDTHATLKALKAALDRSEAQTVICLGDSFHDGEAAQRVSPENEELLTRLMEDRRWIWIAGNHDPAPPAHWGGEVMDELVEWPLVFRHEAKSGANPGELSGHFHPKAAVSTKGRRISARCFVSDGQRLILPSFGAYTGGLNVHDPAIAGLLFTKGFHVWMLGQHQVHRFPKSAVT